MGNSVRDEKLEKLEFFIGEWELEVIHPHFKTNSINGQAVFDWMEKEKFVVQRTNINQPEFPSSTIVYDYDPNAGIYIQHYFDSRGITRLYHMSLEKNLWKVWRDTSDFSQLDFCQRFFGEFNESGDVIQSSWETSNDGIHWEHDFRVVYKKLGK
ncbi:hypothetical protein [Aquisalibacillus elongatus]|uniref:DUF1579 domain-containing protein n=1 Tax=Aquisalibacillus elongatus TaxID=485577 RepID=A0A3N5C7Q4_9BACI|nr:hypothetical protein [Aquisalibacillus elongatus]RPF55502.1 hypothetical protein EDC24_0380 [Aquisalibacillus elongatus]